MRWCMGKLDEIKKTYWAAYEEERGRQDTGFRLIDIGECHDAALRAVLKQHVEPLIAQAYASAADQYADLGPAEILDADMIYAARIISQLTGDTDGQ